MIEVSAGRCETCGALRKLWVLMDGEGGWTINARCPYHEETPARAWHVPAGEQWTEIMDVQPAAPAGEEEQT